MSNTTRTSRTADQWRALIAEQADSGMSQDGNKLDTGNKLDRHVLKA